MTSLSRRTHFGYSLGGIATGTFGTVPGLILMPYLTDTLGVQAAIAGLIVFAPKAWDFVMNPVAGRISDRSRHPSGRRRPFLLRAGLLLAVAFTAMFLGPTAPPLAAGLWVLFAFIAAATAYAFFIVPYIAMAAEITDDYAERTSLLTWRVIMFSIAILVSGGAAPILVELAEGANGYRVMALVMSALVAVGALGVWLATRNVPLTRTEEAGGRLFEQLAAVLRDRDARMLISTYVLQAVGIGMVLGGVVYLANTVLGQPGMATIAFVFFVAPAILLAPAWSWIGRRIGKKSGYVAATITMVCGFAGLLLAMRGGSLVFLVAAAVVGVGYAGAQLFPLAMLPDIAAEDAKRSGVNRIGMITGVWSGFELLGYALGPALLGLVMGIGGYAATAGEQVVQSDDAKLAIVIGISVIPAALASLSLLPLSGYRLDARLRAAAKAGEAR